MSCVRGRMHNSVLNPNGVPCVEIRPSRSWMGVQVYSSRPNTAAREDESQEKWQNDFPKHKNYELEKIYPQEYYRTHDARKVPRKTETCNPQCCPYYYVGTEPRVCEKCYKKYLKPDNGSPYAVQHAYNYTKDFTMIDNNDSLKNFRRSYNQMSKRMSIIRGEQKFEVLYKFQNKPSYSVVQDVSSSNDSNDNSKYNYQPKVRAYKNQNQERSRSGVDMTPIPNQCGCNKPNCSRSSPRPQNQPTPNYGAIPIPTGYQAVPNTPITPSPIPGGPYEHRPPQRFPQPRNPQFPCMSPQMLPRPSTANQCPGKTPSQIAKYACFQRQLTHKRKDLENLINSYIAQEDKCQNYDTCSPECPERKFVDNLINQLPKIEGKACTAPAGSIRPSFDSGIAKNNTKFVPECIVDLQGSRASIRSSAFRKNTCNKHDCIEPCPPKNCPKDEVNESLYSEKDSTETRTVSSKSSKKSIGSHTGTRSTASFDQYRVTDTTGVITSLTSIDPIEKEKDKRCINKKGCGLSSCTKTEDSINDEIERQKIRDARIKKLRQDQKEEARLKKLQDEEEISRRTKYEAPVINPKKSTEKRKCFQKKPTVEKKVSADKKKSADKVQKKTSVTGKKSCWDKKPKSAEKPRRPSIEKKASVTSRRSCRDQKKSAENKARPIPIKASADKPHVTEKKSCRDKKTSAEKRPSATRRPSFTEKPVVIKKPSISKKSSVDRKPIVESGVFKKRTCASKTPSIGSKQSSMGTKSKSSSKSSRRSSNSSKRSAKNSPSKPPCAETCIFDCSKADVSKFCQTFFEENKKRIMDNGKKTCLQFQNATSGDCSNGDSGSGSGSGTCSNVGSGSNRVCGSASIVSCPSVCGTEKKKKKKRLDARCEAGVCVDYCSKPCKEKFKCCQKEMPLCMVPPEPCCGKNLKGSSKTKCAQKIAYIKECMELENEKRIKCATGRPRSYTGQQKCNPPRRKIESNICGPKLKKEINMCEQNCPKKLRKLEKQIRDAGGHCRNSECPIVKQLAKLVEAENEKERQRKLEEKCRKIVEKRLREEHEARMKGQKSLSRLYSKSQLKMMKTLGHRHQNCFLPFEGPGHCELKGCHTKASKSINRIYTRTTTKRKKKSKPSPCVCSTECVSVSPCRMREGPCSPNCGAPARTTECPYGPPGLPGINPAACQPCQPCCGRQMSTEEYLQLIEKCTHDRAAHLNHLLRYKMEWHTRCLQQKYDQMLRDVTMLLEKQQRRFSQAFDARHSELKEQIQELCDKLHAINPNFNFQAFYNNPCQYIAQSLGSQSDCCSNLSPRTVDSCTSSIAKAEQSVAVLENRLSRLRAENADLDCQIQQLRQEQRLLLNTALMSEANAQQKNCELRDCRYNLQNRFQAMIGQNQCGIYGRPVSSMLNSRNHTSHCDPRCYQR